MTVFSLHISNVVEMRSEKKMLRVNAFPVIAGMQDIHAVGNGSYCRRKHGSVGVSAAAKSLRNAPISDAMKTAKPFPTAVLSDLGAGSQPKDDFSGRHG